jgi:hypothetical protein
LWGPNQAHISLHNWQHSTGYWQNLVLEENPSNSKILTKLAKSFIYGKSTD